MNANNRWREETPSHEPSCLHASQEVSPDLCDVGFWVIQLTLYHTLVSPINSLVHQVDCGTIVSLVCHQYLEK